MEPAAIGLIVVEKQLVVQAGHLRRADLVQVGARLYLVRDALPVFVDDLRLGDAFLVAPAHRHAVAAAARVGVRDVVQICAPRVRLPDAGIHRGRAGQRLVAAPHVEAVRPQPPLHDVHVGVAVRVLAARAGTAGAVVVDVCRRG